MTNESRKTLGSILGIIIFIICIIAISYAFYSWKSDNTNVDMIFNEGDYIFNIKYDVNATNLAPILDYLDETNYTEENAGKYLAYTEFTVNNKTSESKYYKASLDITVLDNELKDTSFKYSILKEDNNNYNNLVCSGNFSSFSIGNNVLCEGVEITSNTKNNYRFVVYIDGNEKSDINMMNKSLRSTLTVENDADKFKIVSISLDNKGADDGKTGTATIYQKHEIGIYKDSTASTTEMTTITNPITTPSKTGYTFMGYYTQENGSGDELINANGYITSAFINTYTKNDITLYAYWRVNKPTASYCSKPTYNGSSQTITKAAGSGYTFSGNTGTNATDYTVTAILNSGEKWADGTTANITFTCSIAKRNVTYKADSASREYDGTALTKQTATLTSGSLVTGHTATFSITGTITDVGSVTNTLNSVTIKSGSTDVSSNYNITKQNGTLTITSKGIDKPTTSYCSTPTYNGSSQTITEAAGTGYTFSGNTGTNATSYTVTAKLSSNYKWSDDTTADVTFTCSIAKKAVTYTADSASKEYNGTALTKQTATLTSGSLVSGHTATFSITGTITNVGSTTNTLNSVTIKSGTTDVSSNYDITKKNGTLTVTSKGVSKPTAANYCSTPTYNGSTQTITKTAGTGYTFSGNTGTNATSYTVTAKLSSNYKWSDDTTADVTFTCSIAKKAVTYTADSDSKVYDGTALTKQTATLTSGSLVSGHTATFSITGTITNVGSTTNTLNSVTIKSGTTDVSSNYNITKNNGTLTITAKSLTDSMVSISSTSYTYDGSAKTPTVTVKDGSTTLTKDTDYTVSYSNNTNVGTATVTVTGKGNYKDEVSKSFTISYKTYTITLNNQSATSAGTGSIYGRYANGIYLDSGYTKKMTTSANNITVPTKTGYTFGGYYTETGGSGTQMISSTGYITSSLTNTKYSENVTLHAKWTANTYTVTYDYSTNGGTSSTKTTATVSYGSSVDLTPTATKSGWTFVGWNTDASATSELSSYTMPASDKTLYAIYKKTLTATFYYYNSAIKSTTATCNMYNTSTSCTATVPLSTFNSTTAQYGGSYLGYGSVNTMGTSTSSTVSISQNTNYYVSYRKNVTEYYQNTSRTIYRNAYFTSTSAMSTVLSTSNTGTSNLSGASYTANSITWSWYGYATSSSTSSRSYSTVASAAKSTTTALYTLYSRSVTATFYYYNGNAQASTTGSGTQLANYKASVLSNGSISIPSTVSNSTGPASTGTNCSGSSTSNTASYYGVSTSKSSTTTATPTTATTTYYTIYKSSYSAYYQKGTGIDTIGSTSNSCTNYKTTNGSSYSSNTCSVTLPTITAIDGYVSQGWFKTTTTSITTTSGTSPSTSVSLSANTCYTARSRYLRADELIYDNSVTGEDCDTAQCMIDRINELIG